MSAQSVQRIALSDGAWLERGGPLSIWGLYRPGAGHIRELNRFEREFVDCALQAAPQPQKAERDCPHCNYSGTVHCGDVAAQITANGGKPGDCSNAHAYGFRSAPPPQGAALASSDIALLAALREWSPTLWRDGLDGFADQSITRETMNEQRAKMRLALRAAVLALESAE